MGLNGTLLRIFIVYFCVNTIFRLVSYPLADKKFILVVIEVWTLPLTEVVDPMSFEVVAIALGHNTVTVSFRFVPLAFIDIFVGVYHSALTLGHSVHPVTIVTVTIFVEECSASVLLTFEPVASILTSYLFVLILPVSSLAVALINWPHAFVLVSVLIVLDAEAFLAIITPVSDILWRWEPFITLNSSIFFCLLFLNPENSSVSSIFLSFSIVSVVVLFYRLKLTSSRNE